jgi:hypothetical protein
MTPTAFMNFKIAAGRIASRHDARRSADGWDVTQKLDNGVYRSIATKGSQTEQHIIAYNPSTNKFVHGYQEAGAPPTVVGTFDTTDTLHDHALNGSHKTWDS